MKRDNVTVTSTAESWTFRNVPTRPTRVLVIDHREANRETDRFGLVLEVRDVRIETDYQDDGRTLKVWILDAGETP